MYAILIDGVSGEAIITANDKQLCREIALNHVCYLILCQIGALDDQTEIDKHEKLLADIDKDIRTITIEEVNRRLMEDLLWYSGPNPYPSTTVKWLIAPR